MESNTIEAVKIGLASPDKIREWSYGEVKNSGLINYRTLKPEKDGLFCERIFGPTNDWECHCGKYKRMRYKDKVCERCGVTVTNSKVRGERMGHIELAAPVSHIWYFKGIPSRIGIILDISPRNLEKVLYFAMYIVIDPGDTPLQKYQTLDEKECAEFRERYENDFRVGMGAEAIKELLTEIDLDKLSEELHEEMENSTGQKKAKALIRLEVVKAFRQSGNRPEWMILDVIPVIPPDIRPMVQLDGGRFATSDLNDLYRRVINRNNRLSKLLELGAPEIIVRNEKRMLQENVDALIDNGKRGRHVTGPSNRALMSLSDMLRGKQGRFRQNLLGKRVDYSGRSVIVVGAELKLYQCGLPKEMALELFKPFVMKRLVETEVAGNVKSARKMVERSKPQVWDALEIVIKDHPVMLNRAPTLHRLGIQAFEPVLVEGRAIKLHPLVCTAFNADFDGDQMAVHVPLSVEAQAEARFLMLAANNLLKPSDGRPVTVPTQDMVLGSYYLTLIKPGEPGEGKVFRDVNEATMAYDEGDLGLHSVCKIRMTKEIDGKTVTKLLETTLGKVIFNDPIPQNLGFVDRSDPENAFRLEIEKLVNKSELGKIIDKCIRLHGTSVAAEVLDKIKSQGYRYSTRSGITVAVSDATIPPAKKGLIDEAEAQITKIRRNYERGLISNDERSDKTIETWDKCSKKVASALMENFDEFNPINMMLMSGARGNESQLRQLAGMRGLIVNPAGKTIEFPIRSNYREGLNTFEYFTSASGARKGLADIALRAPDFFYLTRRLVDVSHDVIIREEDCHCSDGIDVYAIFDGKRRIVGLSERLAGRFLLKDYFDTETGELIQSCDTMITEGEANKIAEHIYAKNKKDIADGKIPADSVAKIKIRSPITCEAKHGVCTKCYGMNLAMGDPVTVGEAVGIIAAQSISEPGTQLTMRTFHTGGAKDQSDITESLPRVQELFEARKPNTLAILAEISGTVSFRDIMKTKHVVITSDTESDADERAYLIPYGYRVKVEDGQHIRMGETITEGALNPHDVLAVLGVNAVNDYLIREVQRTYRLQGVDINDKHIEVIVRQMMRKVKVEDPGDTGLLPGTVIEKRDFAEANAIIRKRAKAEEAELKEAVCVPTLMGITNASLAKESFLSAASFQEPTKVLTDAAIKGKIDPLLGLKENVIIGNLIPSGTGLKCYGEVDLERDAADYMDEQSEKYEVVSRTDNETLDQRDASDTSATYSSTIGQKSDEEDITVGENDDKECDTSNQSASADLAAYSCSVGHKSDKEQITVGENDNQNLDTLVQRDVFSVSTAFSHTVILKPDGTVIAIGNNNQGQCCVSGWRDMVAISTGRMHTVGLKSDGTAVAVGDNSQGQCFVSDWKDIVAISTGMRHTVGLKSDGTVVAVGDKIYGTCDVSAWKDIVAISAGDYHTVGLKSDGMVIAVGNNNKGQCNISRWKNIVAISAGILHTVGLKNDGMVIATGNNNNGQCDVTGWRNIDAISAGGYHTVGLKSNRTIVATDYTGDRSGYYGQCDVSDWTNIVAISAGRYHTVGIISDGTIVTTEHQDGLKNYEQPFKVRYNSPRSLQLDDDNLKTKNIEYVGNNKERNESVRISQTYDHEQKQVNSTITKEEFKAGTGEIKTAQDFSNTDAKAKECFENAETIRKELSYSLGLDKINDAKTEEEFKASANVFLTIPDFENADAKAKESLEKAETVRKDTIIADAAEKQKMDDIENLEEAIRILESIAGWKDADERAVNCKKRIEDIKVHNMRIAEEKRTAEQNTKEKTKRHPAVIALMKMLRQHDKHD